MKETAVTPDQIHDTSLPIRERMEALIRFKQKQITQGLESLDNVKFQVDDWERGDSTGGGGRTMVIQDGETFEKGGVNISVIHGTLPPQAVTRMKVNHKSIDSIANADGSVNFTACGLSLVIHPVNPHAPTTHLNYRYFETTNPETNEITAWWFGGGADLTPNYLYEEDCKLFHQQHKDALDKFDATLYPEYKKWCDEYFYIKHRGESRGVGGIFFDDFDTKSPDEILQIVESCFDAYLPSYLPIVQRRKDIAFTKEQQKWQHIRRGRYVEFNLVLDRGTQFGLLTPGSRVESILMTLPTNASWVYNHKPDEGSEEARLLEILKNPVEWA